MGGQFIAPKWKLYRPQVRKILTYQGLTLGELESSALYPLASSVSYSESSILQQIQLPRLARR
jgi:hypothetical protein